MKTLLSALILLAAVPAFADGETCGHNEPPGGSAPAALMNGIIARGEKIPGGQSTKVAELLAKPAEFEGKTVTVEGEVRRACSRKGCWMELAPAKDAKGAGVRVTFKDYGFFVPTDSAGSHARVAGVVKVSELSDEMAKHYESEGATVPRGADGKPREVQLVASGVELKR